VLKILHITNWYFSRTNPHRVHFIKEYFEALNQYTEGQLVHIEVVNAEKGRAINLRDCLYFYRILETFLCRRDVNVRNRNIYTVVSYLGNQRKQFGKDVIMENKPELADAFLNQITYKYKDDPALIFREAASNYFYWRLYRKALQAAWKSFAKRPFHIINIRTYFYIIRHLIFNLFNFDKGIKEHYKEILC